MIAEMVYFITHSLKKKKIYEKVHEVEESRDRPTVVTVVSGSDDKSTFSKSADTISETESVLNKSMAMSKITSTTSYVKIKK